MQTTQPRSYLAVSGWQCDGLRQGRRLRIDDTDLVLQNRGDAVCRLCCHVVFLDLRSLPIEEKDDESNTAEGYQEDSPERGAPSAAHLKC